LPDQVRPGSEAARLTQAQRLNLPVLFVTGFAERGALGGVDEAHIVRKPFVQEELANKVRHAVVRINAANVVRLRR
jgi:hypothetical protein